MKNITIKEAVGSNVNQDLQRELNFSATFSLAFAFISPIVALYSIFGIGILTVGPAFWWGLVIAMGGQLLVALVFSMLVSRFPYEGSIYQWSKYLLGSRFGWFAGWTYICTLPITIATVALGGAGFVAQLFGFDSAEKMISVPIALFLIAFATWGNTQGRKIFATIVWLCIAAEVIGSIGIGIILLLEFKVNALSVLIPSADIFAWPQSGISGFFSSKVALAIAYCGWAFVGFESAGAVAEEVKDPQRAVPKAMLFCLLSVGAVVAFSAFSLILALPTLEFPAGADPVSVTLVTHLGQIAYKGMLLLFVIGFLACMLGIQASVSRVIWAFARDKSIPFSSYLSKLSGDDKLPTNAFLVTGILSALLFMLSFTNLYPLLLAFSIAGFYIAFAFPLVGACVSVLKGEWREGPFSLGVLSIPVIFAATAWTVFEAVNISWPRYPELNWYENWAVPIMIVFLAIVGLVIYLRWAANSKTVALGMADAIAGK